MLRVNQLAGFGSGSRKSKRVDLVQVTELNGPSGIFSFPINWSGFMEHPQRKVVLFCTAMRHADNGGTAGFLSANFNNGGTTPLLGAVADASGSSGSNVSVNSVAGYAAIPTNNYSQIDMVWGNNVNGDFVAMLFALYGREANAPDYIATDCSVNATQVGASVTSPLGSAIMSAGTCYNVNSLEDNGMVVTPGSEILHGFNTQVTYDINLDRSNAQKVGADYHASVAGAQHANTFCPAHFVCAWK